MCSMGAWQWLRELDQRYGRAMTPPSGPRFVIAVVGLAVLIVFAVVSVLVFHLRVVRLLAWAPPIWLLTFNVWRGWQARRQQM